MLWVSVVSTFFYVFFYSLGPGSVPWILNTELFSQGSRPAAMSVAVLLNWGTNFVVAIGFPTMQVFYRWCPSISLCFPLGTKWDRGVGGGGENKKRGLFPNSLLEKMPLTNFETVHSNTNY